MTPPQLVYKVEPEFSEEARKAKHQGMVVLTIEVDPSGNVRNVRVRQSLGLGLDEKAIEAVSHWRFRPGHSGRQAGDHGSGGPGELSIAMKRRPVCNICLQAR